MYAQMSVEDYLTKTAAKSPTPGGGSMAAFCAAAASALAEMAANFTIDKKGYEDQAEEMRRIAALAARLRTRMLAEITGDAAAYEHVMKAYKLPKNTVKEKEIRLQTIERATKQAVMVPWQVAGTARELLLLAGHAVAHGNQNTVTDAAVGVLLARTAVLAALYNVKINLGSIKDEDFVADMTQKVNRLEEDVMTKETEILAGIQIL